MPPPDLLPLPDPVRLHGEELGGADVSTDALRAAALAYAREHLQGTVAFNGPTGWAVAVGRRGINKTLNHGARREHVQSVPALRALLERAMLVFSEANRDADEARNVPYVHTLLAALVVGRGAAAVTYRVRLIVKETNEGYRFYDHDLSAPPAG
jgi:hypothetical protein